MRRAANLSCAALCALACAHPSAPTEPAEAETRSWPEAPARPIVRFVESFPRPDAPPVRASFWSRMASFIVGVEDKSQQPARLLQRPFGLAAVERGFVVADPDARAVLRVNLRDGASTPLECRGYPWRMPMAVAAAPDGALYVADGEAGLVLRIAPDGGCLAIGAGALERPSGLTFVAGRIYVVDPPRHRVVAFAPDASEVLRFGARGDWDGKLNFPTGIGAGEGDTLLVVDALNFRIVRYRTDGTALDSFGGPGDGSGAFGRPKAVATDAVGRIYVTDAQHDVVVVFSRPGHFETAIGGPSAAPGSLTLPAGVAVGDGYLYVADSYNHRVQVYQLLGEAP